VDIDIGCELSWSPASLDFGNVILNTKANAVVSLLNSGSDACHVTTITLTSDSDPNFTVTTATSLSVAPNSTGTIGVSFSAADSAPPHLKTGTLVFQTGNSRQPDAQVPLTAYVNTVCVEASQWIYTVEEGGAFARFDPKTLTFTTINTLRCPTSSGPNSMAVDQDAIAWVNYLDGSLFRVDASTGNCQATSFLPSQHGITLFGMGFVFDPSTGLDTLYVAGGGSNSATRSTLATIAFPSLVLTPIGPVTAGIPEMTGTGDGQLWGFIPQSQSSTNKASLVRLDTTSGSTLESYAYPSLTSSGAWAMKFWGGSFWIFLGTSVYKVSRDTPKVIETVIAQTGRGQIVGAGVSTCAPVH
jgi:streptogramin lyase